MLLGLILTGCQSEPMIQLSQERQASIEAKISENESKETSVQSIDFFDPTEFKQVDSIDVVTLTDYLLIQPNSILTLYETNETIEFYMDFVDSNRQIMQYREVSDIATNIKFIGWNDTQIYQLNSEQQSLAPYNYLDEVNSDTQTAIILLQMPLEKGNQWAATPNVMAEITGIYQEAEFNYGTLQNVVEVTYYLSDYELKKYFAQGVGQVASWQIPLDEQGEERQWQIFQVQSDSRYTQQLPIWQPSTTQSSLLEQVWIDWTWQTNDQLSNVYQQVFENLGWINDTVSIQSVTKEDNVITVNFTSGIVSVLNDTSWTETQLIPALVTTFSELFQVENVALRVEGNGLLPDQLPYPDGGIWSVEDDWK